MMHLEKKKGSMKIAKVDSNVRLKTATPAYLDLCFKTFGLIDNTI